jgi:hypothetical protein
VGEGQSRGGAALSIQNENQIKLIFSWFLPDLLTSWTILPKSPLINK